MIEEIKHFLRKRSRPEHQRLAGEATLWLKDEALNVALAAMRNKAHTTWASSSDEVVQKECWRMIQAINSFTLALSTIVNRESHDTASEARRAEREENPLRRTRERVS